MLHNILKIWGLQHVQAFNNRQRKATQGWRDAINRINRKAFRANYGIVKYKYFILIVLTKILRFICKMATSLSVAWNRLENTLVRHVQSVHVQPLHTSKSWTLWRYNLWRNQCVFTVSTIYYIRDPQRPSRNKLLLLVLLNVLFKGSIWHVPIS